MCNSCVYPFQAFGVLVWGETEADTTIQLRCRTESQSVRHMFHPKNQVTMNSDTPAQQKNRSNKKKVMPPTERRQQPTDDNAAQQKNRSNKKKVMPPTERRQQPTDDNASQQKNRSNKKKVMPPTERQQPTDTACCNYIRSGKRDIPYDSLAEYFKNFHGCDV